MKKYYPKGYFIPDTPTGDVIKVLLVLVPGGLVIIAAIYGVQYWRKKKAAK